MSQEQLLRDPDVYPADDVLAVALGNSYDAYTTFAQKLPDFGIELEWRYYNDGKSWLGKCVHKKKTVFWLSIWNGYFKTTMFFTEKTRGGVHELPISDEIKAKLDNEKPVGRLIPLLLEINNASVLDDAYTLIKYKKSIK
jgi:hypothetical protein